MNSCMIARATQQEEDAAREQWFAEIEARKREREEKERENERLEKFHRDWWGLPQNEGKEKDGKGQGK